MWILNPCQNTDCPDWILCLKPVHDCCFLAFFLVHSSLCTPRINTLYSLYGTTNKMQRFLDLFISINCCTCFRWFLRPSSGAQNCTSSVRYCQTNIAACCYYGWDETIPDVCKVLCSWWWAEELPETCRAIYRNKQIEKTLHLVGCTLEILLRCTDIRTSNSV